MTSCGIITIDHSKYVGCSKILRDVGNLTETRPFTNETGYIAQ